MESMQSLITLVVIVTPVLALFVIGRLTEPTADRRPMRSLRVRDLWSTVVRGNSRVAPALPGTR